MSQKTVPNYFCQNFVKLYAQHRENFWRNDGKVDMLMCRSLIFHLTYFISMHHRAKQMLQIVTCYMLHADLLKFLL